VRTHRFAFLGLTLLLSACATQTPALTASSLAAMQRDSVDSVDVTLGPMTLGFLRWLGKSGRGHSPDRADATNLMSGLHEVQIHSFQFATDHAYRRSDLQALRSQLAAPGWRRVVQVRGRGTNEDVDIYCSLKNHTITRLVIIDAEPREFTLVNIVGTIDADKIGRLRRGFVPHEQGKSELALTRSEESISRETDRP
jgi:hypothetical protein